MLIAEKWANRSSPPPSGVMNPKPLASLNHFTVPVAISVIPHEQKENGTRPGQCFDLKERTTVERAQSGRTGRTYCLETKTRWAGYTTNPRCASGILRGRKRPFPEGCRRREDPRRAGGRSLSAGFCDFA